MIEMNDTRQKSSNMHDILQQCTNYKNVSVYNIAKDASQRN